MNSLVKDAIKLVIITVEEGLVLGAEYGITKKSYRIFCLLDG